jgi:riboflavin kinase/FMN adenylyltransferase
MILFNNINEVNLNRPVVTIGFFDGVHLGHSQIIEQVTQQAKSLQTESLLITFWPHPRVVLRNDSEGLKLLTTLNEKRSIVESKGVTGMLIMDFTPELASVPAIDFIQHYLVKTLNISAIVLGYNHAFGYRGQGNYHLLKKHEVDGDYSAIQVGPFELDGLEVSSTKIREALEQGNLQLANDMLGLPYSVNGIIEGGQQLGRSIGFPTANIKPISSLKQIPANGVYAVWVDIQGQKYPAMLNIGIRPTLGSGLERTIEAHIIGFSKNIYSEQICISFVKKIREEQRFPSLEHLKEQLVKDKENTISLLG